jgi:RNA polymerase sigma factor (TIGR02999 family)
MATAPRTSPGEITRILVAVRSGDSGAVDRLLPLIYDELRRMARGQLRREYGAITLSPTDLVHEAYLKLAGGQMDAENRVHFMAIAARAMRQVLVDQARRRRSQKRGAGATPITLTEAHDSTFTVDPEELIALDAALDELDARQREIVEYRFFGGLEEREIAALLGISDRTVRREWIKARAWLYRQLYGEPASEGDK